MASLRQARALLAGPSPLGLMHLGPVWKVMGVLLLLTIGLVLASGVLLILGFVFNVLGYIYVSLLCIVSAGITLLVWGWLSKRRGAAPSVDKGARDRGARGRTAPRTRREMPSGKRPDASTAIEVESAGRGELDILPIDELDGGIEYELEVESDSRAYYPPADSADAEEEWDEPASEGERGEYLGDDWGDEIVFPIADYDDLRVSEIVPILPELDPDELEEVHDRESAGRARTTILDRIDELLGRRPARRPITAARTQPSPRGTPTTSPSSAPEASPSTARRRPGGEPGSSEPAKKAGASSARVGEARAKRESAAKPAAGGVREPGRVRKAVPTGKAAQPGAAQAPARQGDAAKAASAGKAGSPSEAASPSEATPDGTSSSEAAAIRAAKAAAKQGAATKRDR